MSPVICWMRVGACPTVCRSRVELTSRSRPWGSQRDLLRHALRLAGQRPSCAQGSRRGLRADRRVRATGQRPRETDRRSSGSTREALAPGAFRGRGSWCSTACGRRPKRYAGNPNRRKRTNVGRTRKLAMVRPALFGLDLGGELPAVARFPHVRAQWLRERIGSTRYACYNYLRIPS